MPEEMLKTEMTEKPGFAEKFWWAAQHSGRPCLWVHGLNSCAEQFEPTMTTEPEQWAVAYPRPFFNQILEGFRAYFFGSDAFLSR